MTQVTVGLGHLGKVGKQVVLAAGIFSKSFRKFSRIFREFLENLSGVLQNLTLNTYIGGARPPLDNM